MNQARIAVNNLVRFFKRVKPTDKKQKELELAAKTLLKECPAMTTFKSVEGFDLCTEARRYLSSECGIDLSGLIYKF